MEEKNQRAIEFLGKKSDLNKGDRKNEKYFRKNNAKIRIKNNAIDFYYDGDDADKWNSFAESLSEDIYSLKKNSKKYSITVKDQNTDTETQCSLLYELFDKWQSFQSASDETQSADAEPKVKKNCESSTKLEKTCNNVMSEEYNYKPCTEQFPECFDGNVKLGIVNNKPEEIQYVASFADWSEDFQNNLNKIEGNTILFGLNISSSIGKPWENFHSTSDEDERLKYACEGVFDRAYITDLIKDFPNGNSSVVMKAFKNNETLRHASVEMFVREIAFLIHCGRIEKNKPLHIVLLGPVQKCMKCKIAKKKIKDLICDEINNLGCKKIIFGEAYHFAFRECSMSDDQAKKEYREQFKRLKEKMPHAGNEEVVDNPHRFKKTAKSK
ncbi:MAG: hypothetical protein E7042_03625 [Lentisphaerae bacterium]|nr:hypothetical protein [Lentisphaerota bacterium]